jgi:hypothetical protein
LITLFSATEVILDNAAGIPVFKSRQLLENVQTITPYRIGGVDVNSNGIVVKEEGSFSELGVVGFAEDAAENIWSQTTLLDCGFKVQFDDVADQYRLTGNARQHVFFPQAFKRW